MAEIVSSALVHETVSQLLSNLVQKYEYKEESRANRNLERLQMAHIWLEAALDISDKWQVTDASLLRWHKKLKRAAQECDDTLHKCKQRIVEGEQMEQEVRKSSFPTRVAHATKSCISSAFGGKNELSGSIVQRFEWYVDGASDFLRFTELGGTPRHIMPFNPLIRNLFTGKNLQHKISLGNECTFFLLWIPFSVTEHGIEASLFFLQKDGNAPENNFYFSVMLQLSESTDIVGIAVNCLQLFTPLSKSTVEIIRNRLVQLPTQDFRWAPYVDSQQKEHWDNHPRFCTQWFRPDPLCCKQLDQHELCCSSKTDMSKLPDISLQPVKEVNL